MKSYYFLINSLTGGGAERVVVNLAKQHLLKGEKVFLFTLRDEKFYDLPEGITYIPLSKTKKNMIIIGKIRYVCKLRYYLKKYNLKEGVSFLDNSNIIHILSKKDAVVSFRTSINQYKGFMGYLKKCVIKILYPRANKIIVNSRENKMEFSRFLNIPESRIEVWYNAINKEEIYQLSHEKIDETLLKKLEDKKVFITVSRLVEKKKIERMLFALEKYNNENKDWIFLVLGKGEKEQQLKDLVKDLGIEDKVFFLGQQKNVFSYLKCADYFLFSSDYEGFPNALLEARVLNVPIITTDFKTGAKEIVLGEDTNLLGKELNYPYYGKYGVLLDPFDYRNQLSQVLKKVEH